jgi:hypothetical protein
MGAREVRSNLGHWRQGQNDVVAPYHGHTFTAQHVSPIFDGTSRVPSFPSIFSTNDRILIDQTNSNHATKNLPASKSCR